MRHNEDNRNLVKLLKLLLVSPIVPNWGQYNKSLPSYKLFLFLLKLNVLHASLLYLQYILEVQITVRSF